MYRTPDKSPRELEGRVEEALEGERTLAWGWSGGAAAMRLTGHYRGERTVLCTAEPTSDLPRRLRALPDEDGPLVMLRAPGPVALEGVTEHTVHPLQAEALRTLIGLWPGEQVVLVGAAAMSCFLELRRNVGARPAPAR